jgi:flavin-dependent dehydrogenase
MSGPDHFQVVIVGGGFGGLTAARAPAGAGGSHSSTAGTSTLPAALYQVATGGLSGEIAFRPLRPPPPGECAGTPR